MQTGIMDGRTYTGLNGKTQIGVSGRTQTGVNGRTQTGGMIGTMEMLQVAGAMRELGDRREHEVPLHQEGEWFHLPALLGYTRQVLRGAAMDAV